MHIPFWLKTLIFIIIFLTSIILPLSLLDSSLSEASTEILKWSGDNKLNTSIIIVSALTADVLLPVPNGLTNTFAGAGLGFIISVPVIWFGLMFGSILGYFLGRKAARPIAKKLIGKSDLKKSEEMMGRVGVLLLVVSRPAPAFAEISTVAAGLGHMSFKTFILVMTITNFFVALIYAAIGSAAIDSGSATYAFIGIAVIPLLFWLLARKYIN